MIKSSLLKEFMETGKCGSCPVIDMHQHMGPFQGIYLPNSSAEAMIRTMDRCGVKMGVFCSHAALIDPEENVRMVDVIERYPDRFRAYWCINPNYPERIEDDLDRFSRMKGFVGFKFLSDYHKYPITGANYKPALEYADENELLILMHTWGGSPYDSPAHVEKIAKKYHKVKILMGHSGFGEWEKSIQVARDYPNVYLELTAAVRVNGLIELMVRGAGSEKILFGTDLPWFDPHHGIGCILYSRITDEDRHNILHRNAERLLQPFL